MSLEATSAVIVFGIVALAAAGSSVRYVLAGSARERQSWMLAGAIVVFPLSVAWIVIFVGLFEAVYLAAMGISLITGLAIARYRGR